MTSVYQIYDTKTKEYITTSAKNAWKTPGAAKNAAMLHQNISARHFKDQVRYECHRMELSFAEKV